MAKRTLPIGTHFSTLVNPRVERTRKHALLDIIVIAILAVICDSDGWDEMADWSEDHEDWLRTILDLSDGVPTASGTLRARKCSSPTLRTPQEPRADFDGWAAHVHRLDR